MLFFVLCLPHKNYRTMKARARSSHRQNPLGVHILSVNNHRDEIVCTYYAYNVKLNNEWLCVCINRKQRARTRNLHALHTLKKIALYAYARMCCGGGRAGGRLTEPQTLFYLKIIIICWFSLAEVGGAAAAAGTHIKYKR